MSSDSPKITVGIPTVRALHIGFAIKSVLTQTLSEWELLIMGQGDEAVLRQAVEEASGGDHRVRYLHQSKAGTCAARNAVFGAARADIIALMDDDCEADPNWLETIDEYFTTHPRLGILGGEVRPPDADPDISMTFCARADPGEAVYDPTVTPRVPPKGFEWIGCNLAMRKDVVEKSGFFDECLGPGSAFPAAEDVDFLLRLESAGVLMMTTPRSIVHHTYGRRYGWENMLKNQRNYARGNGGLSAKLVMAGDPRGKEMMRHQKKAIISRLMLRLNPRDIPVRLRRIWYMKQAYNECLKNYRYNPQTRILEKISE